MTHHLVVAKPFLNFVRGDTIEDTAKVSEILTTEYRKFVIKVAAANTSKG